MQSVASMQSVENRQEESERWLTAAELAECNCPDPCERDHGNE